MVLDNRLIVQDPFYTEISSLRQLFFSKFYNDSNYILELLEIIRNIFDPISIEFDGTKYAYYIKIKKTSMRKLKGFAHVPEFYYTNFINKIISAFICNHMSDITRSLTNISDPNYFMVRLLNDAYAMASLCNVTCISDNILIIKL